MVVLPEVKRRNEVMAEIKETYEWIVEPMKLLPKVVQDNWFDDSV